ncbi:transposase family protein [Acidipropionibacterium jensenii]|uniref:transposase family protein n=1 Tax=Acidipropionibacterium jensenii TaxID=1749 RepID=UPI00110BD5C2|nr:transposase family protein [Acidipropionibacterium jensenii]QCV87457.1 transposase family protein [Acidipropionibacterium jensenii]
MAWPSASATSPTTSPAHSSKPADSDHTYTPNCEEPNKGYQGAGIGICHPIKGHGLAPDTNTRNRLITQLRAPAERANAIIKHFKALQKVTLDPWRITQIVRSALVIATHVRGAW